jgi:hypothetical protein
MMQHSATIVLGEGSQKATVEVHGSPEQVLIFLHLLMAWSNAWIESQASQAVQPSPCNGCGG